MDITLLQNLAANNQWAGILPEILVAGLALLLLILEIALPKKQHDLIPGISIAGQLAILVALVLNCSSPFVGQINFNGLIKHTEAGQFMRVYFLLASVLVSVIGTVSLAKQKMPRIEFFHIVLVITAALMLLAQSNHFVLLFVALETVTIGFYILVSYFRTSPLSLEAGLKYLIMGALSSSILLFGIVLLYGVAGNPTLAGNSPHGLEFGPLSTFLAANPDNFIAKLGVLLVISGIAFKIGGFPFQIWIPDVYQGAPTPVTAFLAVSSKAAGFAMLALVTQNAFAPYADMLIPVLAVMAGATLIFGNLAALTQYNVKRIIGLSGVSHAGFLLLGIVAAMAGVPLAIGAMYFYLFVYLLASFAVFGVMAHISGENDAVQELDHYRDLAKDSPFLAGVLAVGLGSLAGIPPLAGFMGKLLIFVSIFKAGFFWLLALAIIGVVMSIYYYFGWIKAAFFETWRAPLLEGEEEEPLPRTPVSAGVGLVLAILVVATIILGFYQGPLAAVLQLH